MAEFDVIIIGGGAAGLMCAGQAVQRGRRVLVIEKSDRVGEKIRISGGGRANFTNLYASPANYLSDNPRFCVSALARYTQHDFIALIEKHGIAYHERDHGQLFCDETAQHIIDLLRREADGASIQTSTNVTGIFKEEPGFRVDSDHGAFTAPNLVIATGGPSIPKMGASGFGYDVARQFGLGLVPTRAGLVPLTFDPDMKSKLDGLSGVSVDATAKLGKVSFTEALLFTHRGLSGPVILQISSYWKPGDEITLDLLPGTDVFAALKAFKENEPRKDVVTVLAQLLPRRLAQRLVDWCNCGGRLAETPNKSLQVLADQINSWKIKPNGSEGMRTAEVTLGGVDTRELSSKTMEARSVPGLYFIGEAVDVTGHLGGFNFQWAWASGFVCGQVV